MTRVTIEEQLEQCRQALLHYAHEDGEAGNVARMVLAGEDPWRTDGPYLISYSIQQVRSYNPSFGDDRQCECGHLYYRHFDTYDDMYPCGCKYCDCDEFRYEEIR